MSPSTILGIDLGGTKTAVARFDADSMQRQAFDIAPTHARLAFPHVYEDLLERIKALRTPGVQAVGVGIPGLINQQTGTILTMPNIPQSEGVNLAEKLETALKLPVIVENDASCFTYAEAMMGAGKGEKVVVGLTLGTGVGGGIVIDGKLFQGAHGYAAEIGHMLLVPGQPPFATKDKPAHRSLGEGGRGEVEQFLSGTALGKRCEAAKNPKQYLAAGEVCSFMHPDLYREVAWLVTSLTHLLDPSIIVLGGSAGIALKPHFGEIERELKNWLLPHTPVPRLTVGTLEDAATVGAALLAKEWVQCMKAGRAEKAGR